jgi:CRISPR-associated protein Csm4
VDPNAPLAAQREAFERARSRRRAAWATPGEFRKIIQGERLVPEEPAGASLPKQRGTLKNSIDRLTGATPAEGGGLYEFQETFTPIVTVYALVDQYFETTLSRLLEYLAVSGFGKRKTVGYGALAEAPALEPFEGFGSPENPNGFVSLSTFVPARHDPTHGYWNLLVKYGKLGEELAYSENPFKRPVLMLRAGAVFFDSAVREFYGRLVEGVSPHFDFVMQPSYCLPVPMRLPEGIGPATESRGGESKAEVSLP